MTPPAHDIPFQLELPARSFAELRIALREAGHSALIGEDGVIRLGLARIRRCRAPRLDDNDDGRAGGPSAFAVDKEGASD